MPARRTIGYIAAPADQVEAQSGTGEPVGTVAPDAACGAATPDAAWWDSVRY